MPQAPKRPRPPQRPSKAPPSVPPPPKGRPPRGKPPAVKPRPAKIRPAKIVQETTPPAAIVEPQGRKAKEAVDESTKPKETAAESVKTKQAAGESAPAKSQPEQKTTPPKATETESSPDKAAEVQPAWLQDQEKEAQDSAWSKAWQALRSTVNLRKLGLGLGLLILLIVFAIAPAFRLHTLESSKLFLHSPEELMAAAGLTRGQHFLRSYGGSLNGILTGRYEGAEQNILKNYPELRSLRVYYQFPSTLRIEAEERIPLAFLDVNDSYVTVDRFGVVTGSYQELPQGLPAIRGIEPVQMRIGEPIKTNADEALKACVAVMAALVEADFESPGETLLLPQAKEIRSSGYQRILLTFQPQGASDPLRVTCSSTGTLKEDFLWLKRVLDSKVLQDKLPGNLDIYGSQLVFRPYTLNEEGEEEVADQAYVWEDEIFQVQEVYEEELYEEELYEEEVYEEVYEEEVYE